MAGKKPTLLLLPPLPQPPTYAALTAAYHAPLLTLLRSLSQTQAKDEATRRPLLDIALLCPHLNATFNTPRSTLFLLTQKAVANFYKLICIICAKNGLQTDGPEAVDARILLVRYPRDGNLSAAIGDSHTTAADTLGPIVSIEALASSRRWSSVYSVESEQGESALRNFLRFSPSTLIVKKLRGGIIQVSNSPSEAQPNDGAPAQARRHFSVANGGTFDHLHIGHKLLLTMTAFALDHDPEPGGDASLQAPDDQRPRTITIGLTAADLLKNKKYAAFLEPWRVRYEAAHAFMRAILCFGGAGAVDQVDEVNEPGPNGHAVNVRLSGPGGLLIRYVEIWDPFGPTVTDEGISALVLSQETRKGGQAVNEKRTDMGWEPLEVFEVDVLDSVEDGGEELAEGVDTSFETKLSSTAIRKARSEKEKGRGG